MNAKMVNEHGITGRGLGPDSRSAACRRGNCRACTSVKCLCQCGHLPAGEHTTTLQGVAIRKQGRPKKGLIGFPC